MISVIIPHYCTKKQYFEKCMRSLLKDKNSDIEVLIIDDGSPEDYLKQIEYFLSDKRVRLIRETHRGVSNARNVGIREADGEWLMFVDSDDYLEDGYYSALHRMIQSTEADFLFFNGYGEKNGHSIKNQFFIKEDVDYGHSIELKSQVMGAGLSLGRTPVYCKCLYTLGSPYSKLIRTSFLRENNITFDTDVKFAEDTLFSLNLILNAGHIFYYDEYLYHYNLNDESVTGKYRKDLHEDMQVFFRKTWEFIYANNLVSDLEEAYYIRAFLEVQRSIRNEFAHKKNPDSYWKRRGEVRKFINSDPFRRALHADYPYLKSASCRIAKTMVSHGCLNTYMFLYSVLSLINKINGR